MEIVSIDGKNFHKVTKNKGFTLSLEDAFLEKPQRGAKLIPHQFPIIYWND